MRIRFLIINFCVLVLIASLPAADSGKTPEVQEIYVRTASEDTPHIKVGLYASLSGSASLLGQMGQQGCRLAVEEINNAGGINGKEVRLIEYDDQTDPDVAAALVRKMIEEDRVDAIVGSHTSGNIIRTAPITEQAHVLQIGLGTSYLWTNQNFQYLFRATGNSQIYDDAIFAAVEAAGHRRIAVYYCSTDYAQAGAEALMKRIYGSSDMQLVWSGSNDIDQTDFKRDFRSLMNAKPDAVILYANSENAGIQLLQLREDAGYTGAVYGPEAFSNSSVRQEAGDGVVGLVYTCTNFIPDSPVHAATEQEQNFLEQHIKMYGTMPTAQAAYRGYDAMMILAEVFRTADSLESEDLRAAMLKITNHEGICGTFDFSDGSGDGLKGCQIVEVLEKNRMEAREYP